MHLNSLLAFCTVFSLAFCLINISTAQAQALLNGKQTFTRADTLRGTLGPERNWFDVYYYDLNIELDYSDRFISGYNDIYFSVERESQIMQIDLFENLEVDSVLYNGSPLKFEREFNAVFIDLEKAPKLKSNQQIRFYYSGKPTVAKNAPWDGGFVFKKDTKGKDWIGVACQGMGASSWWPTKDHQSDEPDSMRVSCAIPTGLKCISNGNFEGETIEGDLTRWHWFVKNPINNYNVSVNIGNYASFEDIHINAETGDTLPLRYYVLEQNLDLAKAHFEQVKPMMNCYEEKMGAFPFYEDGFALIETPYLGMEHQSGIAYGNNYKTGYAGTDYSRIGLDFDYIIIHEAGHEWWGNSLTSSDIADLWIHEGFCTYSEAIYVECMHGYEVALDYVNAKKPRIGNEAKIIGHYGVNKEGDGDMYNKGMLFLNTLRHVVDNDAKWWSIIKGLQQDFRHQIVDFKTIVDYINEKSGKDMTKLFEQYLDYPKIPVFQYSKVKKGKKLKFRWQADVENFDMPIKYICKKGKTKWLKPNSEWQTIKYGKSKKLNLAEREFYFEIEKL